MDGGYDLFLPVVFWHWCSFTGWMQITTTPPKNLCLTNNTQPKSLGPAPNVQKISKSTWERDKGVLYLILLRKMTNKRGQSDTIHLWMLYRRQTMAVHCCYFSICNRKISKTLKLEKFRTDQIQCLSNTWLSCEFHCMRYCQCNLLVNTQEAPGTVLLSTRIYIFFYNIACWENTNNFFVRDIKREVEL